MHIWHIASVFENYVRDTGCLINRKDVDAAAQYGKSYGEMLLYVPENIRSSIESLNRTLTSDIEDPSAQYMFKNICKALSEHSPRIERKNRNKPNE